MNLRLLIWPSIRGEVSLRDIVGIVEMQHHGRIELFLYSSDDFEQSLYKNYVELTGFSKG